MNRVISKRKNMKIIIGTLCGLLIICSFGCKKCDTPEELEAKINLHGLPDETERLGRKTYRYLYHEKGIIIEYDRCKINVDTLRPNPFTDLYNSKHENYETYAPTIPNQVTPDIEFSFIIQGGAQISATVFPAPEYGQNRKIVIFAPFLGYSDGNFYQASIQSLKNIYGENRGLFYLKDAQRQYDSITNAYAMYWEIYNPSQRFYFLPIIDSDTNKIGALVVWVI